MIEIIHVSDLHIGKRTRDARRLLAKLEERFAFREHQNRHLLITGDITQDGSAGQYETAAEALRPFAGQIHLVPGNHDYGFLGFVYTPNRARNFDRSLADGLGMDHDFFPKVPYFRVLSDGGNGRVLIVGLNSCSQTGHPFDIAAGEIGGTQLDELDRILNYPGYEALPKLVFLHHIPHRKAEGLGMSLRDHAALTALVSGRVRALAHGHEGAMNEPEARRLRARGMAAPDVLKLKAMLKTPPPERPMRIRRAGTDGGCYHLDANRSVDEMSCYHVIVENGDVNASLVRLEGPPAPPALRRAIPRRGGSSAGPRRRAGAAGRKPAAVPRGPARRSK